MLRHETEHMTGISERLNQQFAICSSSAHAVQMPNNVQKHFQLKHSLSLS